MKRNAIALLITLFFIMAITLILGVTLSYVNSIAEDVKKEKFMLQTRIALDDVLSLLKGSKEIDALLDTNGSEGYYMFLAQSGYIPLNTREMEVIIEIKSARSKINPNSFKENNTTVKAERIAIFKEFLNFHNVDYLYADIVTDGILGVRDDYTYLSEIFNYQPHLFRDYIASKEHLELFNSYFKNRYRYNTLTNIDFDALFYYSKDKESKIDLNFATVDTWMFLLGCDRLRAEAIYEMAGLCSDYECFGLGAIEQARIEQFNVSFYEPVVEVGVTMFQNDLKAIIQFEYDMKSKKGSNFVYKI